MSTDDTSLVSSSQNGLNSHLIYQEDPLRFTSSQRPLADPGPKTRELAGFIDDKLFASSSSSGAANRYFSSVVLDQPHRRGPELAPNVYQDRNWSVNNGNETSGDDDSDGEEEDDDDDDEEELDDDEEAGGAVVVDVSGRSSDKHNGGGNNAKSGNSNGGSIHGEKMGNGNAKAKDFASYGSSGAVTVLKDGQIGRTANVGVTIANLDGEMFYSRYLETADGSGGRRKEIGGDNSCGFDGRKDGSSLSNESGESLRAILSDPVTGALMNDAMILLCGHSFGNGGVQHALRMVGSKLFFLLFSCWTIQNCLGYSLVHPVCGLCIRGTYHVLDLTEFQKCCYTCSRPVSEESISPNLGWNYLQHSELLYRHTGGKRSFKVTGYPRGGERDLSSNFFGGFHFDELQIALLLQERGTYGDSNTMDPPRGRGVQFPFSVADRVIIKGNKRTPERFVGREAIVTTQCLNGWYVVKTLDNAESVKLQYRSLAKVSTSKMTPNWL
ncbi:U-box domain-containing protein 62 [Linum perenne]